jgi:uncharacterized protein
MNPLPTARPTAFNQRVRNWIIQFLTLWFNAAQTPKKTKVQVMKTIAIKMIRLYQLCVSPLLGLTCRFAPSCSEYAAEAFQKQGFFKGFWLTVKRLGKCHPWHPGGYDPVNPDDKQNTD